MKEKAITVCQPYAHLLVHADASGLPPKRVENRTWKTEYRGVLWIHAGKNRDSLFGDNYGVPLASMDFGALIGRVVLEHCAHIDDIKAGRYDRSLPWLRTHAHVEGPWCWIMGTAVPCGPWPWKGAQGLWTVDQQELDRLATKLTMNRSLALHI